MEQPTSDLGNLCKVIQDRKGEDETCDTEICPLHVFKGCLIGSYVVEEDIGPKNRRDHSANTVEGLRDIDPDFRIFRRSTDYRYQYMRGHLSDKYVPAR